MVKETLKYKLGKQQEVPSASRLNGVHMQQTEEYSVQKVIISEYKPGEPIVEAGASQERFFVILKGKVEITLSGINLRSLKEGDIFGIEYYYLNKPYEISATAQTHARIASYHSSLIYEIIYNRPQMIDQMVKSMAGQIDQTTQLVLETIVQEEPADKPPAFIPPEPGSVVLSFDELFDDDQGEYDLEPEPAAAPVAPSTPEPDGGFTTLHDEALRFFIDESKMLLSDLKLIGEELKFVGIPNADESAKLAEFAQKLNRLIGGAASMGFEQFSQLSRRTSLLATRCAEIKNMTIRLIITNLNLVVAVLAECFTNLDTINAAEGKLPMLEQRLDICMTSIGMPEPELKNQDEIDEIMGSFKD